MKVEALQQVSSVRQAQLFGTTEDRHGQFHRAFTPRQIHVRTSSEVLKKKNG